ncbi:MAG: DUF3775 domain-containing protein [Pseudomonadota bacterium]
MAERNFDMTLDPAVAYRIVELAREFAVEGDGPDDFNSDEAKGGADDAILDLEDRIEDEAAGAEDPIDSELHAFIDALNVDAQKDLLALIWLGRDGGSASDWHRVRRQATQTEHLHVAQYLEETPLASDHLVEGLLALGYDPEE